MPWDAVNDGKGSFAAGTCEPAPSGPGTPAPCSPRSSARRRGAVGTSHVLVSLTTAPAGRPDDIWPTDAEYECGLSGLERRAPGSREWEVFNEPDSDYTAATTGTDCTHRNGVWVGSGSGYPVPAGKRFGDAVGRQRPRRQRAGGRLLVPRCQAGGLEPESHAAGRRLQLLLARGARPRPCYYLGGYFRVLSAIYPHPPDAIALNPYIDVSYAALNGGDPAAAGLVGAAQRAGRDRGRSTRVYPSDPPIWFTEVGVWLTDGGKEPVTSRLRRRQSAGRRELGGVPERQPDRAGAGRGGLPAASRASRDQVQRVYYYDFDGQNPGWDSGLVNLNPPLLGPHGYGVPRTTWCVLHDYAHGATPDAAARRRGAARLELRSRAARRRAGRRRRVPERSRYAVSPRRS